MVVKGEEAGEQPEEEEMPVHAADENTCSNTTDAKTILHGIRSGSSYWEQIVAALLVLGLTILSGFAVERLATYWSRDTSDYYNPNYAIGNNVNAVILHSTLGFLAFLMVPVWLAVTWFLPSSQFALLTASALSAACMIATFATVPFIKDPVISSQSGTAVTITAVVWAIWWLVTCVLSGIAACRRKRHGRWGAWAWWIRFMGMTVFGFALLPIFYSLSGNLVGSAVALIFLFVVCLAISEWIIWRGVVPSQSGDAG